MCHEKCPSERFKEIAGISSLRAQVQPKAAPEHTKNVNTNGLSFLLAGG